MSTSRVIATIVAVGACAAEEPPFTNEVSQYVGQTWHVAPEPIGSTSGNGSLAMPWTLAHASTCAGGQIQPGDRVVVANGTYWGTFEMRCSGTSAQPITYVAATRHRAEIDSAIREFATPMFNAWEPHVVDASKTGFPYKLYYNTFVVREPKDLSVSIGTVGEYANLAASSTNPNVLVPTRYSGTPHEVYNNIFVDQSGFTPGPTYWVTGQVINGVVEGRERYDGNVYSGWSATSARPIYRYARTSSGTLFASPDGQGFRTPEQLRAELAILNETKQYPIPSFSTLRRGWEKNGFSRLALVAFDSCYRPTNCPECQSGAVSLVGSGWPGTATNEPARGAVQPTGCL